MCTAKICVQVTRRDDHCRIEDRFEHNVYVLDCAGKIFEWCGKQYVNLKTRCGLLEIEVPPGCYVVGAVDWSPNNPKSEYLGNNLTHVAVVRVNCDDRACVTLFDPSLHFCGTWFRNAATLILAGGGPKLPTAATAALQNVVQATTRLLEALPNKDSFVENQVKAIGTTPPKGGKTESKDKKGR